MKSFFNPPSLLRLAEDQALARLTLHGRVLDLGGDKHSAYHALLKGNFTLTTVNFNTKTAPDMVHDLEKPLPIENTVYDGVLLINVLEHIFNYRELLTESVRVLQPRGQLVIVVPFLFPIHPSPHDYHRFTGETLHKECSSLGLEDIQIKTLGRGVFSARYLMLERLLPGVLRGIGYISVRYLIYALDELCVFVAKLFRKQYDPRHYALGYIVTAQKPVRG